MSEISEEEIVNIANGFLLSSPPGEFMEVVTDVRGLLQNDSLLNASAPATFKKYNTSQMLQVKSPAGNHEALITKFGELRDNEYLDPRGRVILTFDHIQQKVTGHRPASSELDATVEPFRRAIDDAARNYTEEHYQNGSAAVYGKSSGGQFEVIIAISSSKFNPNNFWNGRWRSTWIVTFKPGGQATLKAKTQVNVHYYEDGNVQLATNWEKTSNVAADNDPEKFAAVLLKHIASTEQNYHTALENSYTTMGETTFKALRRVLPISRQKIDWQKIRHYKIGGDIGSGR
jgi:capping protein alpha